MAEENNAPSQEPGQQNPQPTPQGQSDGQGSKPYWQTAGDGTFKSEEEFVSSYKEAQKKISENSIKIKEAEKYINDVVPVLQAIHADPELYKAVEARLMGKSTTPTDSKNDPKDSGDKGNGDQGTDRPSQTDLKVNEVETALRTKAISEFENSVGISNLKEDEAKQVREKLGQTLNDWGWSIKSIPLNVFDSRMSQAYQLAFPEKFAETEKLRAAARTFNNMNASTGPMPSGSSANSISLTENERKVASKLGMTEEEYSKSKKQINQY